MADPGRLDELKRRFDENPKRYFAPLANEYRKAGEAELAIELCRTYLPQQPTHMSGYIVYGQALHDAGRTDEAAAVFKQALMLDPENIIALRQLGDIARDSGDRDDAMRWYGKVMELDPRNEEIASFMGALAEPALRAPHSGPERVAPPTIRPEPAPDDSAVRLEDIVSEPDVAQQPSARAQPPHSEAEPAWEEEFQGTAGDASGAEPVQPFEVAEWPTASSAVEHDPFVAGDSAWDTNQWEGGAQGAAQDHRGPSEQNHQHDPALAPRDHLAAPGRESPASSAGAADDAATAGSARADFASPFVTETMAELYMQQGLHGEALVIYRQLSLKRDDPALRDRIAQLERETAQTAPTAKGETVRQFFARIGTAQSHEKVRVAGEPASPLESLFGGTGADASDMTAAQRLAAAFGSSRTGESNS